MLLCQCSKDKFLEHYIFEPTQRESMRILRLNLPNGNLIILVDFAMNFSASSMKQAQDALFSSAQTTLFIAVVWQHVSLGSGMYVDRGVGGRREGRSTTAHLCVLEKK